MFAKPLTEMKMELVKDLDVAKQLIAGDDELVIRVSKGMKRTHIDKASIASSKNTLSLRRVGKHAIQIVPKLVIAHLNQSLLIAY